MRALDLFCGAGGASIGLHQAGFSHIVGIDINKNCGKRYPFDFVTADALQPPIDFADFDMIWASPWRIIRMYPKKAHKERGPAYLRTGHVGEHRYTRHLCDNCEKEIDVWAGIDCDCYDHGILEQEQCPTCWEWRDSGEYTDPYTLSCCHDCHVHAKTMVRLGIVRPDDTIIDIFHERVRMRNCVVCESMPITNIALYKGKIIGETVSGFPSQVVWQEYMKEWQVVDGFLRKEDT